MPKKRQDIAQFGHDIMQQVIAKSEPAKNPAAVALGRLGGLKGGRARAAALTKVQRQEIARKGAETRWAKKD